MKFIHWQINILIEKYLTGALSPDEFMKVEAHFAKCSQCRQKMEQARVLSQEIKNSSKLMDDSWEEQKKFYGNFHL